jgi:CelD/BcsL family acetyltransferase involved in cellulose biosynthesis
MDRVRLVRVAGAVIEVFDDIAALPADAMALLAAAEREEFHLGAGWFATVAAHARPAGARPLFLLHRQDGRAAALLPLWRDRNGRRSGMTSPYTCLFRPLLAEGIDVARAGRAFGAACRRHGPLRLDALDPDWPSLAPLLSGFARAGLVPLRFFHFGNWHADVAGLDWAGYLAGRPGELRETIRRRLARAARDPSVVFEAVAGGSGLEAAIAAYADVYARSWKQPEPFPDFGPAVMRAAAAAGVLRLGVLRQGGAPIAAQYWTVTGGTARVEKLAHDEGMKQLSPGTVLTARTIGHLLGRGAVATLDFGRGDDAYKAGWTGRRRARIGVLLCPPWHPAGLRDLGRHLLGHGLAAVRERLGRGQAGG